MRGTTGLKLAMPFQIQYIRPERLKGPRGNSLTAQEQRTHFGLSIWSYFWEGLPWPDVPDNALFLEEIARVQKMLGHGLPLVLQIVSSSLHIPTHEIGRAHV